jgi:hypothetical protein
MASKAPDLNVDTILFAVSGTGVNIAYTVGDNNETAAFLLGVTVTDSTGAVATAALVNIDRGTTNYVLASTGLALPSATENLEIVCEPAMKLKRSDKIEVTGATGHHVFITIQPIGRDTGGRAQKG